MPTKLLRKLVIDYPGITFQPGRSFKWSARHQSLTYNLALKGASALLLHELAHVLLGHDDFTFDVELVRKERLAWEYAQTTLGPHYSVSISDEAVEDAMDSYRAWLHKRSLCPQCNTSCLQTKAGTYKCLACRCQWRANDAREHALRRYVLKT